MSSQEITRRKWLKTVAATAVAGGVVGRVITSCSGENGNWSQTRVEEPEDVDDPFDVDEILSSMPGEVGCVECGRCMPCWAGVNIPAMYVAYNKALESGEISLVKSDYLSEEGKEKSKAFVARLEREIGDKHLAHRCARCGWCEGKCPKQLPIVQHMKSIGRYIDLTRETF